MTKNKSLICPLYSSDLRNDQYRLVDCDGQLCAWWCKDPVKPEDGQCAIRAIASAIRGLGAK